MALTVDKWGEIESKYRSGVQTILEIATQYGITDAAIHKHAKQRGWKRDLKKRVSKLVRAELTKPTVPDAEIIQKEAAVPIAVVGLHRADARREQEIIKKLVSELTSRMSEATLNLDDIKSCATIMRDLTQSFARLVAIEREAYGLSKDFLDTDDRDPKEVKVTFVKANVNINVGDSKEAADRLGNNIGSWVLDNTQGPIQGS